MKITISSVLSALAAVAVVSGFIVPNHGVVNHHFTSLEQASAATFLSKFRSNSRLLMSETRTFERREGRGSDSSYQGRGGGRGRGGE
jgi:hypothetical protein